MLRHARIGKELHQHLRHLALDKSVVLMSITFLPHVNDFDIAVLNGPHQALVHVVVDLIRIEVWMVKNSLYQIFQLRSVDIVFTDMVLQDAFAL